MTRICDAFTRFVREHPVRAGCAIALTIILAFGVGYTAHFWDKLTLAERVVIPVVGGVGGGLGYVFLLKVGNRSEIKEEATEMAVTSYVPDRLKLHQRYLERNKDKAHRVNPLKIVSLKTKEDLEALQKELEMWKKDAELCLEGYRVKENEEEGERFASSFEIAESIQNKIDFILKGTQGFDVKGIYDKKGDLQAICISYLDNESNEYMIDFLASAPHNLKTDRSFAHFGQKRRSEGAATALLAEVVFKAIQVKAKRSLSLISTFSAISFYKHLGFAQNPKTAAYTLEGASLFHFLENYGGRVHPSQALT